MDDPTLPMHVEFALSANERGRRVADFLECRVPLAGKHTIDAGCAYGGFLVAMAERGARPQGIDVDASWLALARHNFADAGLDLPVHRADLTRPADIAPFAGAFDVVTCNDVLEHVADPAVAVRHVGSMLRPSGLAYFEIPNPDAVDFVLADGLYLLFGITQLEHDAARRYYAEHKPGAPYNMGHYLRLDEYRRLFEAARLTMEVVDDGLPVPALEYVEERLRFLRQALDDRLQTVPEGLREQVRAAILRYLAGAGAAPRERPQDRHAFVQRYGAGFWRVLARPLPATLAAWGSSA